MKHKFINYGLFGTILVFLVVLGCKEDDFYYKNQSSEQGITIKKVSFDDIMKKSEHREFKQPFMEFKEKISLKNNQNRQGKLIYNEEYSFYIDDENGMFIEKEGISLIHSG